MAPFLLLFDIFTLESLVALFMVMYYILDSALKLFGY